VLVVVVEASSPFLEQAQQHKREQVKIQMSHMGEIICTIFFVYLIRALAALSAYTLLPH